MINLNLYNKFKIKTFYIFSIAKFMLYSVKKDVSRLVFYFYCMYVCVCMCCLYICCRNCWYTSSLLHTSSIFFPFLCLKHIIFFFFFVRTPLSLLLYICIYCMLMIIQDCIFFFFRGSSFDILGDYLVGFLKL